MKRLFLSLRLFSVLALGFGPGVVQAQPAAAVVWFCNGLAATIVGTDLPETIYGGAGADVIVARGGDDIVYGGDGADTICLGDGNDSGYGENGNDVIFGGDGDDHAYGGDGNDVMWVLF